MLCISVKTHFSSRLSRLNEARLARCANGVVPGFSACNGSPEPTFLSHLLTMPTSMVPLSRVRRGLVLGGLMALRHAWAQGVAPATNVPLAEAFSAEVQPRLHPDADAVAWYTQALQDALLVAQRSPGQPQFVLLVDRNPAVQALLIFWGGDTQPWQLLGASPVSTGLPGRYEHFETPLGVFDHDPRHGDFRAEGTLNVHGVRGYGVRGMRVFDFGWVAAAKGWGDRAMSTMRLQMHATDPDLLEPWLGSARSKGCVRISASLNRFLDRYGLIDQAYEQRAQATGKPPWVWLTNRQPGPWAGRYLVVVESPARSRSSWAPPPAGERKR